MSTPAVDSDWSENRGLAGGLGDVDQSLVSSDLKLITRIFMDKS
jgi:hypothetical protein